MRMESRIVLPMQRSCVLVWSLLTVSMLITVYNKCCEIKRIWCTATFEYIILDRSYLLPCPSVVRERGGSRLGFSDLRTVRLCDFWTHLGILTDLKWRKLPSSPRKGEKRGELWMALHEIERWWVSQMDELINQLNGSFDCKLACNPEPPLSLLSNSWVHRLRY